MNVNALLSKKEFEVPFTVIKPLDLNSYPALRFVIFEQRKKFSEYFLISDAVDW